jgi:hypothetical protein
VGTGWIRRRGSGEAGWVVMRGLSGSAVRLGPLDWIAVRWSRLGLVAWLTGCALVEVGLVVRGLGVRLSVPRETACEPSPRETWSGASLGAVVPRDAQLPQLSRAVAFHETGRCSVLLAWDR